jgi:hypothetical protein
MVLQIRSGHKNKLYMVLQTWSSHHIFFYYSVNIYTMQRGKLQNQPEKLQLFFDISIATLFNPQLI